jgi:pheromone alpha factor receptor
MQFSKDITEKLPEVGTQVLTVVCIFMPLSAIWAGVVNEPTVAHRGRDAHQRLIHSNFGKSQSSKVGSDSTTAINPSSHSSACADSKGGDDIECSRLSSSAQHHQMADDSIYVDREFSVRTETSSNQV